MLKSYKLLSHAEFGTADPRCATSAFWICGTVALIRVGRSGCSPHRQSNPWSIKSVIINDITPICTKHISLHKYLFFLLATNFLLRWTIQLVTVVFIDNGRYKATHECLILAYHINRTELKFLCHNMPYLMVEYSEIEIWFRKFYIRYSYN